MQIKNLSKKRQNELLQNTLGFMAAESETVKDNFQQVKDCTAHAQVQSSQIGMSSLTNPSEPFRTLQNPGMSHSYRFLVVYLVMELKSST